MKEEKKSSVNILIGVLKQIEIFRQLPQQICEELGKQIKIFSFTENENIIAKGESGDAMYIIVSGKVKVHDGEFVVAALKENNFFGEIALLTDIKRTMSVTAEEKSSLGIIHRSEFYDVLKNYPQVAQDIISVLCHRLMNQNESMVNHLKTREEELGRLVDERTRELREAQKQIIQSEKLASLGQLTAGIAHEIQNPLNFVNNFSALSIDLLTELKDTKSEEEKAELIGMLTNNLSKIEHHGKRADGIVRGMLMHSHTGKGEKHLTNINALCEESISFFFHSMRAKYPEVSCQIEKHFAADLLQVNVIQQEISRVFINLLGNAFYAVKERIEIQEAGNVNYKPLIIISTTNHPKNIEIKIKDNGIGIPENIMEKIFLPFFTTKPTGEGTGLGLSITHDIIKSHGGEIKVESEKNSFTEFIITLPI